MSPRPVAGEIFFAANCFMKYACEMKHEKHMKHTKLIMNRLQPGSETLCNTDSS